MAGPLRPNPLPLLMARPLKKRNFFAASLSENANKKTFFANIFTKIGVIIEN